MALVLFRRLESYLSTPSPDAKLDKDDSSPKQLALSRFRTKNELWRADTRGRRSVLQCLKLHAR